MCILHDLAILLGCYPSEKHAHLPKDFITATVPNSEGKKSEPTYTSFHQGGELKDPGYIWSTESEVVIRKAKRKQKTKTNRPKWPDSERPSGHMFWLKKKASCIPKENIRYWIVMCIYLHIRFYMNGVILHVK